MTGTFCRSAVFACALTASLAASSSQAAPAKDHQPQSLTTFVEAQTRSLLDTGVSTDNWSDAARYAEALLLRIGAGSDASRESEAWIAAAKTVLLTRFVAAADESNRSDLAMLLRKYPAFADDLLFLLNDKDDASKAAEAALHLHTRYAGAMAEYPALAAALCAVHDRTVTHRANENTKQSPRVEDLFAHFVVNKDRIWMDLRKGPPELLCYAVDVAPDIKDLKWACDRYAGATQIGALYNFIAYDYDHMREGKRKRVTVEGFNLPNIARYGGVCVDQAYFAAMVGKAIGVPAIMLHGAGQSGVGHCWVGYLTRKGAKARWDMTSGRYAESLYFSGETIDPRSGESVSEAQIGVTETLFATPPAKLRLARSIVEAARLLAVARTSPEPLPTFSAQAKRPSQQRIVRRQTGASSADDLLRDAYKACPALPELWRAVVASAPTLDTRRVSRWIDAASRVGGRRWSEFTFDITQQMLAGVASDDDAMRAWDRVASMQRNRPDLVVRARVAMAQRAEKANHPDVAFRSYKAAISDFAGKGPAVLDALQGARSLLVSKHKPELYLDLLDQAWRRVERPSQQSILFFQSVWARVGMMYAEALTNAGREQDAQQIMRQIKSAAPSVGGH